MKITLFSADTVRFEDAPGPLTIEAASVDVRRVWPSVPPERHEAAKRAGVR